MSESTEGHTLKGYDGALSQLRQCAHRMGILVSQQVETAVRAPLESDRESSELVLQREQQTNAWQSEIEAESLRLLARQAPVAMERTRLLKPVFDTVFALEGRERIGDHAKNVAEHVVFLVGGADVRHAGPPRAAAAKQTRH